MAAKDIQYGEAIPEEISKYLVVVPHAVFFPVFDTDQSSSLPKQTNFIDSTRVPFIGRALKRFGPGPTT
jgi:hypothetical protein